MRSLELQLLVESPRGDSTSKPFKGDTERTHTCRRRRLVLTVPARTTCRSHLCPPRPSVGPQSARSWPVQDDREDVGRLGALAPAAPTATATAAPPSTALGGGCCGRRKSGGCASADCASSAATCLASAMGRCRIVVFYSKFTTSGRRPAHFNHHNYHHPHCDQPPPPPPPPASSTHYHRRNKSNRTPFSVYSIPKLLAKFDFFASLFVVTPKGALIFWPSN